MALKRELYSPLASEQDSESDFETRLPAASRPNRIITCLKLLYITALHVVLVLLAATIYSGVLSNLKAEAGPHDDFSLWPSELPFAKPYVKYETVIFSPSGFNDLDGPATPYEGPPTPEKEALWYNLTKVGMYSLTEDEYNQLDITTVQAVNAPEQRLVTIEVFHQLHCLNYIRRRAYEVNDAYYQEETDWSKINHISHCIDYLRQVLMCHADLTPITLELAPGQYRPNFSIKHSCRNWDLVYEFAKERNISGTIIE